MDATRERISVTILATCTAVLFIALTYWLPKHAVFWLSVEVVLLPAIYIVGNAHVETTYRKKLLSLARDFTALNKKYYKERALNKKLRKTYEIEES